ncbi:choice-of-anchor tandem repeat GloVer-containing protein, partial [Candidatus Neomarinimicrobiota bacterium]
MNKWFFSLIMALFVLFMTPINAQYTVLYEFQDGRGGSSLGHLVVDGTIMYGMQPGGDHNKGVVFKIDIDGTDYTPLHHFTGSSTDGANPSSASLVLDGTTLYGTAQSGGNPGGGVIFKINTDGSGYSNIYNFGYSPDGAFP